MMISKSLARDAFRLIEVLHKMEGCEFIHQGPRLDECFWAALW